MASFAGLSDAHFVSPDMYMALPNDQWPLYEDGYELGGSTNVMQDPRLMMCNTASHGLSSIQRFFGAYDDSPFTASPFHSSLRKLELGDGLRPQVPETFSRGGSPADTASSKQSFWTSTHSDYAGEHYGKHSISSQTSYSPAMSCATYDASPMQQVQMFHGGGCVSLNNIQQYDPDQTHDETDARVTTDHVSSQAAYEQVYDYNIKAERHDSHHECEDSDEKPSTTDIEGPDSPDAEHDEGDSDTEYQPNRRASGVVKRPRRRSSNSSSTSIRGTKRGARARKDSLNSATTGRIEKSSAARNDKSAGNRHFPCPFACYGCASGFSSKNEWKRHVSTQHIKLIYWRCDLCLVGSDQRQPIFNDFNRKDLFTQHLRRMHSTVDGNGQPSGLPAPKKGASLTDAIPEAVVAQHQARCCREIRQLPPQSACLFCARTFTGKDSWTDRMDHIGTHLEKDRKVNAGLADCANWRHDPVLEAWLLDEGLIARDGDGAWELGDGVPLRAKREAH